jgi:hypothetical protein
VSSVSRTINWDSEGGQGPEDLNKAGQQVRQTGSVSRAQRQQISFAVPFHVSSILPSPVSPKSRVLFSRILNLALVFFFERRLLHSLTLALMIINSHRHTNSQIAAPKRQGS